MTSWGCCGPPGWTRCPATGSTRRASWNGPGWWPGCAGSACRWPGSGWCATPRRPRAAAAEVAAFWAQAEADHASRRDLAAFLVRSLEGGEDTPWHPQTLAWPSATRRARTPAAAGRPIRTAPTPAPGCWPWPTGWAARGHLASAAAIDALKPLETAPPAGDLLNALENAVAQAGTAVAGIAAGEPGRAGSGTTLTAMLLGGLAAGPGAHRGHPRLPAARTASCSRSPTTTPSSSR